MPGAHAKLAPSSAAMWMNCPGSIAANAGLPDDDTEWGAEGSVAHLVSDQCLTDGKDAHDFIGERIPWGQWRFVWTEQDADLLQPGIDWVREQPGQFYSEHRVDLSHFLGPGQFGTLDRGIVTDDLIIINDLKWGRGVPVKPYQNEQLQLYALGFWWNVARQSTTAEEFLLVIDQPRNAGGGGMWRTSLAELLEFGETVAAAAKATDDPDAARIPSLRGCQWCRRKDAPGGCPEFDTYIMEKLSMEFEDLDGAAFVPLSGDMTPARRSTILTHKSMIEKWLENLQAHCISDALKGNPTDGLKAVEGPKNPDKWSNTKLATAALPAFVGDICFTEKLKTPKQVGKSVSQEDSIAFEFLIERGKPRVILVPEEDERPAIGSFSDEFDELH